MYYKTILDCNERSKNYLFLFSYWMEIVINFFKNQKHLQSFRIIWKNDFDFETDYFLGRFLK